jgi:hypothetical protein
LNTVGWKPANPLAIWESQTFSAQAQALASNAKRLDAQLHGLTWAIASDPEQFDYVIGNVRIAVTDEYPDAPRLRVVFTIDYEGGSCSLQWIELA